MARTHVINGQEITIEWECGGKIDSHGSGEVHYEISGIGSDGNKYNGTGIYQSDELEDVEDVEMA